MSNARQAAPVAAAALTIVLVVMLEGARRGAQGDFLDAGSFFRGEPPAYSPECLEGQTTLSTSSLAELK